jgi:hypothetical protein
MDLKEIEENKLEMLGLNILFKRKNLFNKLYELYVGDVGP